MEKALINYLELCGTSYEIGYHVGKRAMTYSPQFIKMHKASSAIYTEREVIEMAEMFNQYCPGLNEELQGFADAIGTTRLHLFYYAMAYLVPGCSLLAVLPRLTDNGHVMVARNYEFSHKMDDLTFCKTKVTGKYSHLGSSIMNFGRSEGINEHGLMIAQTSCGRPVGNMQNMRKPAVKGLQFCAIIRSLLENCMNVSDALKLLKDMPIAYNINLILADKSGKVVLFETYDGNKAWEEINENTDKQYLHSTNHPHLPEIVKLEPMAMENSVVRYKLIESYMEKADKLKEDDLKELLLSMYPTGLCCHWYDDFFGTIRSVVFDVTLGTADVCWGGRAENGWKTYSLDTDMQAEKFLVSVNVEHPTFDLGRLI